MSLECVDGVITEVVEEERNLLTKEADGVVFEHNELVFIIGSRLLRLGCLLLKWVFDFVGLLSESLGIVGRVANVDIVEQDVGRHCPKLDAYTANVNKALEWRQIFEEVRVRNLAGLPFANVCWVVDKRCIPLALVIGVGLVRAAKRSL